MNALMVLFFVLVGLRLLGVILQLSLRRGVVRRSAASDPCLGPVLGVPPELPQTPEDTLYTQLRSGLISQSQYRAGMARLARLDDRSHPVELPPGP